ncbi:MAG: hypothetical protein JMN27_13320 [gamma proteobacterium endosymbiont of Lamellibrachia anaximandri]|nr:hypothetical protein [gamma proteobacterium endosymbiont of Lamellibrachia anaximandri]MBL3534794.1 hypothetical protein [gamma proteobacterium endosymbiont of Lamellibrachia anaximandri]
MSLIRLATISSLAYLLPLTLWLTAQLELNDWAAARVTTLFDQAVHITLIAQIIGVILLFFKPIEGSRQNDISAVALVLFFPLPLLTLSWLSGSLEIIPITLGSLMVALTGLTAFGIRQGLSHILPNPAIREGMIGALLIAQLILLWQFRQAWWGWTGL